MAFRLGFRTTILTFAALVLLGGGAPPCFAATYYIAPTGNDATGDGSSLSPWREIRRGIAEVEPGDTVLVADGVYLGFTVADLGAVSSPITIRAEGRYAEILPT